MAIIGIFPTGSSGILPIEKGGTGNNVGRAVTANTLTTARVIRVNLAKTNSTSFDGSVDVDFGVTDVLPLANGGTGNTTGRAVTANALTTARTVQVNLASASSASFNGSANITPGVAGILPLTYGGTGASTANNARLNLSINGYTTAYNAIFGTGAGVSGSYSVAMGYYASAMANSTSVGRNAACGSTYGVAMGAFSSTGGISATAMGYYSNAFGANSIALGRYATGGNNSIAIGHNAKTAYTNSTTGTTVYGNFAVALGYGANVGGSYSIAIGSSSSVSAYSTAVGGSTSATGTNSTSVGYYSRATGTNSVALGRSSLASGSYATALGYNSSASGVNAIVLGANAIASGLASVALGVKASATNACSAAIGEYATASGELAVALGEAKATGSESVSIGFLANASNSRSVALGKGSTASGNGSVAVGNFATASGSSSIALGNLATASGSSSTALGYYSNASGSSSVALGYYSNASNSSSVALGYFSNASGLCSMALGFQASVASAESHYIQIGNPFYASVIRVATSSITYTSDERDKTDLAPLEHSLEFLSKIQTPTYVYNRRSDYEEDISEELEKLEEKAKPVPEFIEDPDTGEEVPNPDFGIASISVEDEERLVKLREHKHRKDTYGRGDYDHEAHARGDKKGSRRRTGVLAQQVQSAMLEQYGSDNYADLIIDNLYEVEDVPDGVESSLGVNYTNFIPFLIDGVNRLYAQNQALEQRVVALEGQISDLLK